MLSRIAEALYWIGRYVERAEDTSRILDVHLQRMLADPWTQEDSACRSLLAVMGKTVIEDGPMSSTREYGDVPPLKGVYAGPKSTGQAVEVTITRLRWSSFWISARCGRTRGPPRPPPARPAPP